MSDAELIAIAKEWGAARGVEVGVTSDGSNGRYCLVYLPLDDVFKLLRVVPYGDSFGVGCRTRTWQEPDHAWAAVGRFLIECRAAVAQSLSPEEREAVEQLRANIITNGGQQFWHDDRAKILAIIDRAYPQPGEKGE